MSINCSLGWDGEGAYVAGNNNSIDHRSSDIISRVLVHSQAGIPVSLLPLPNCADASGAPAEALMLI